MLMLSRRHLAFLEQSYVFPSSGKMAELRLHWLTNGRNDKNNPTFTLCEVVACAVV